MVYVKNPLYTETQLKLMLNGTDRIDSAGSGENVGNVLAPGGK